jgi:hypothetical protein
MAAFIMLGKSSLFGKCMPASFTLTQQTLHVSYFPLCPILYFMCSKIIVDDSEMLILSLIDSFGLEKRFKSSNIILNLVPLSETFREE